MVKMAKIYADEYILHIGYSLQRSTSRHKRRLIVNLQRPIHTDSQKAMSFRSRLIHLNYKYCYTSDEGPLYPLHTRACEFSPREQRWAHNYIISIANPSTP